jgi:hypothetical protein
MGSNLHDLPLIKNKIECRPILIYLLLVNIWQGAASHSSGRWMRSNRVSLVFI